MVLAMTICEICPPGEVEMMISVLLNIFNDRTSLLNLIKLMIDREVAQTGVFTITESRMLLNNFQKTKWLSSEATLPVPGSCPPLLDYTVINTCEVWLSL